MGQDARVRYTKMIIQVNFVALLKKKPLNKITVKEICDMAQINRATFYRYYIDVYDLMEQLEAEILKELNEMMVYAAKSDVNKTLCNILEKLKANGELYTTLFSANGDPNFPLKIFKTCYSETESFIRERCSDLSKEQQTWLYVYMAQGISGVISCWITHGMAEPPEQVAGFVEKLVDNTLREVHSK